MAPVYVKGGMWTNVEDEILKAAIAKYGLNQWSRVSSLLTKKNAKQCKLRWNEWLDPRIKKHAWSPEEDKQLLNLARLRPNQWSSISLLINRTANQCIERYQELLSDHTLPEGTPGDTKMDALLLSGNVESTGHGRGPGSSLGGLNLNPESKPARPDLDHMDEDEKEMISEARARLANTQGKKAKRKAREKILEESQRVADLLRRRELKQVGIDGTLKTKKKFKDQMDYNADIAFERRPEAGKFDTSNELRMNIKEKVKFDGNTKINGTFNQEVEAQKRKEKHRKKQNEKLVEQSNGKRKISEVDDSENDAGRYKEEFLKRRKLDLSTGDATGKDIDVIIGQTAKEIHDKNTGKSVLFSRKESTDAAEDEVQPTHNNVPKKLEKLERKKLKELRRSVLEQLKKLPEPLDDFEIDFDNLLVSDTANNDTVVIRNKGKSQHVILDRAERKRQQKKIIHALSEKVQELLTPQSQKFRVPLIKNVNFKGVSEIDKEMLNLMNDEKADFSCLGLQELEATLAAYNEVQGKIDDELANGDPEKYNTLINSDTVHFTKNQLIHMIKSYTNSSKIIEDELEATYTEEKKKNGIDSKISSILERQQQLDVLENELWAYTQFQEMEKQSIETRKTRLQKELDYINYLIEQRRKGVCS